MTGTSLKPKCCAASRRPWPAITVPSSAIRIGCVQPYSTSDAASRATWSSECSRGLRAYGFRRATGHCSICSGRKRKDVMEIVLSKKIAAESGEIGSGEEAASARTTGSGGSHRDPALSL
jgi:hypothetical protein